MKFSVHYLGMSGGVRKSSHDIEIKKIDATTVTSRLICDGFIGEDIYEVVFKGNDIQVNDGSGSPKLLLTRA